MHDRPSRESSLLSPIPSHSAENLFISAASFWLPRYIVDSAWLEHAPFAFWLSEALAPRRFVELGTHSGFSYLCFCQAFNTLGLDTSSYAVDTWKGDEHSGHYGSDVLRNLRAHHDMHYSASSQLVESTFDEASSHFADASIDLLHIDGRHDYESVAHDFLTWQPRLSDRAVVLLHDTNVYERGFGVNRLWTELRNQFPSFEFLHGHGLGILGIGAELPHALRRLCEADSDLGLKNDIRRTYARLGSAITASWTCEQLVNHITSIEAALQLARARVSATENESKALLKELEIAKTVRDGFSTAHADLAAERDALARAHADLIAAHDGLLRDRDDAVAKRDALLASRSWRLTAPLRRVRILFTPGRPKTP